MGELPEVEEFCLSHLRASRKGLGCVNSMPRLRSLCIQYVPVDDGALVGLAQLANLECLNLGSLKSVGDGTVAALERLPRLQQINLARTGVSDAGLRQLNRRIESLNLFETKITDEGVKSLLALTKMKHVALTGTRVSDTGIVYLAKLPALESVYLGNTAVTSAGVAAFRNARGLGRPVRIEGSKGE